MNHHPRPPHHPSYFLPDTHPPLPFPRHTLLELPPSSHDPHPSDADSSLDSKFDDLGPAPSDCPSPSDRAYLTPTTSVPTDHHTSPAPPHDDSSVYDPVDFDFSLSLPHSAACADGVSNGSFRDLLTADYLEEREFDFKELLRRERNRAAAHRSNIKKKQQKEARKTELAWLQRMERQLRARELDLRRQNKCLRALVYLSGQRLPLIPMNVFQQEVGCVAGAGVKFAQLPRGG